jgi:hypothetical protein
MLFLVGTRLGLLGLGDAVFFPALVLGVVCTCSEVKQ